MKCAKCQFENLKEAKFCNECGCRLELACPECKKPNPPGSRFCNECGHNLQEPKEPPDYSAPQSYTPKFLADKILTSRSSIEGERKLVTVLFADVANYTTLSEKLDPEEVHQIMDGCFKILMDEIHRYEGTINQFLISKRRIGNLSSEKRWKRKSFSLTRRLLIISGQMPGCQMGQGAGWD